MNRSLFSLIGQRLISIAAVSIAIVFFTFWAMAIIISRDSGAETVPLLELAIDSVRATGTYFSNLLSGDLGTVTTVSGKRRRPAFSTIRAPPPFFSVGSRSDTEEPPGSSTNSTRRGSLDHQTGQKQEKCW